MSRAAVAMGLLLHAVNTWASSGNWGDQLYTGIRMQSCGMHT